MEYLAVRELIKDGDIVFLKPKSFLGLIIPFLTGGDVSHCGFATWLRDGRGENRLMMLEGFAGGCRLVNLSSYAHRNMRIVRTTLEWADVEDYALNKTGMIPYGYLDFVWIWVRESLTNMGLPRLSRFVPDANGEVCSQMVADVLVKGNFPLKSTLLSPATLIKMLVGKIIEEFEVTRC